MKFRLVRQEFSPAYRPGEGGEWNGGNYPQPTFTLEDNVGVIWKVVDASCGDFGTRRWVTRNGVTVASWGTMEDSSTHFSMLSGRTAQNI